MHSTTIASLQTKVKAYLQVLENTISYRQVWKDNTKNLITETLQRISEETGLKARIISRNNIENLEAVAFDLGRSSSGIAENLENTDVKRIMVKNNGSLVYQQLFNGKIMVMLISPYIEGFGEAKPPQSLAILRPAELSENSILRHVENMLDDVTEWEDYDDDDTKEKLPFHPIGFQHALPVNTVHGEEDDSFS